MAVAFQLVRTGNVGSTRILAMTESYQELWYFEVDQLDQYWIRNIRGKFQIYPFFTQVQRDFPPLEFSIPSYNAGALVGVQSAMTRELTNPWAIIKLHSEFSNNADFTITSDSEEQISAYIEIRRQRGVVLNDN